MPRIDFCIVGAAKSATTSLHKYLEQHPDVFLPDAKELAYFIAPVDDPKERRLFETAYARRRPGQLAGLSHANMLLFPDVPARIQEHNPQARIIAILRNPIDRAYSAYWFAKLRGWDPHPTFEEALLHEKQTEFTSRFDRINFTYLEQGHYAQQLQRFIDALGADRVKILLTEDLATHPNSLLQDLHQWLGLSPHAPKVDLEHNKAQEIPLPRLQHWLHSTGQRTKNIIPTPLHPLLRRLATKTLPNTKPFQPPPMQPSTRARLRDYFQHHNDQLSTLIGRDLSHWT